MNETLNILENRKSLRAYDTRPLTLKEKDIIVRCAIRAPTAGNMMHFSMIEVADQKKKNRLVKHVIINPLLQRHHLSYYF